MLNEEGAAQETEPEQGLDTVAIIEHLQDKGDLRYAKELLLNKIASDLFPPQRPALVTVKKTDLIAVAFKVSTHLGFIHNRQLTFPKKLIDNKILSAPVYDVHAHAYIGFIDMLDMVAHVLSALSEGELIQEQDIVKLLESRERFANDTCATLTGALKF